MSRWRRRGTLAVLALCLDVMTALGLEVPPFTGLLVDRADLLSTADRARVTARLESFQTAGSGQMAILIIPSLQGESIDSFGIRVGDAWKAGRKEKDDGLILIVAREDRAMRVEVGYGLEGAVNDARAGDVIRAMGPAFREGRYAEGLIRAVDQIEGYIRSDAPSPPTPGASAGRGAQSLPFPFVILMVVVIVLLVKFANNRMGGPRGGGGIRYGGGGGGFSGGGGGRFGGGGASGKW